MSEDQRATAPISSMCATPGGRRKRGPPYTYGAHGEVPVRELDRDRVGLPRHRGAERLGPVGRVEVRRVGRRLVDRPPGAGGLVQGLKQLPGRHPRSLRCSCSSRMRAAAAPVPVSGRVLSGVRPGDQYPSCPRLPEPRGVEHLRDHDSGFEPLLSEAPRRPEHGARSRARARPGPRRRRRASRRRGLPPRSAASR
jgi:hypothetical protein